MSYRELAGGVQQVNAWTGYVRRAYNLGHYPTLNTIVLAYNVRADYRAVISRGIRKKSFSARDRRYLFIPVKQRWLQQDAVVELSHPPSAAFPFNRLPVIPIATPENLAKIYPPARSQR